MHGVTLSEQQFRQVGTVLSGYACVNQECVRIKETKEKGSKRWVYLGGGLTLEKKTVAGVHAPVIKATLPGVLFADDLGEASEVIIIYNRSLRNTLTISG